MLRLVCITVLVSILLSGCVIHLKPGISWCTNKQCIYDAYGLSAVKDLSRRTKKQIIIMQKHAKRHVHHHESERTGIAKKDKVVPIHERNVALGVSPDTLIPQMKNPIALAPEKRENLRINFAFDKDSISLQDKENIRLYMAQYASGTLDELLIKGFTDNAGSRAYNKHLSIKRARRVYDYLISIGIPSSKLTFKGFDFRDPVADNTSEEGRSLNRRVEVEVRVKEEF